MQVHDKLVELFGIGLDSLLRYFGSVCPEGVMYFDSCPATIQVNGLVHPIHDLGLGYTCEKAHLLLVGELDLVHVYGSQALECLQMCFDSKLNVLVNFSGNITQDSCSHAKDLSIRRVMVCDDWSS